MSERGDTYYYNFSGLYQFLSPEKAEGILLDDVNLKRFYDPRADREKGITKYSLSPPHLSDIDSFKKVLFPFSIGDRVVVDRVIFELKKEDLLREATKKLERKRKRVNKEVDIAKLSGYYIYGESNELIRPMVVLEDKYADGSPIRMDVTVFTSLIKIIL